MFKPLRSLAYRNVRAYVFYLFGTHTDNPDAWITALSGSPMPSDQPEEEYKGISSTPSPRRFKDRRAPHRPVAQGHSIENERWELTLAVEDDEITFDKTGQVSRRFIEARQAWGMLWEERANELLANSENATKARCWDKKALFSTAHSGGQSNLLTMTGIADVANPGAEKFERHLWDVIAAHKLIKNDQGRNVNRSETPYVLMFPSHYSRVVAEVMNATHLLNSQGDLIPNVMVAARNYNWKLVENDEIDLNDGFLIFRDDGKTLIRQAVTNSLYVTSKGAPDSEFFHDTGGQEHGITEWNGIGCGRWESAIKGKFAA